MRTFGGTRKKKLNNGGKRHIRQQCKTRYKLKVVKISWTLWRVAELIWSVEFMTMGCQGARRWKKFGNCCCTLICSWVWWLIAETCRRVHVDVKLVYLLRAYVGVYTRIQAQNTKWILLYISQKSWICSSGAVIATITIVCIKSVAHNTSYFCISTATYFGCNCAPSSGFL
jgi:hypothetical protein